MPARLVVPAALAAILFFAAPSSATINPGRGMSGVSLGMTKAQVKARLGRPVAAAGGRWFYPRVWVVFRGTRAAEITTTRSTERTAAGLGVDSTEAQVRRFYPQAVCGPYPVSFRRCRLGSGRPGTRVTDFLIGRGRVLQVTIALLPL